MAEPMEVETEVRQAVDRVLRAGMERSDGMGAEGDVSVGVWQDSPQREVVDVDAMEVDRTDSGEAAVSAAGQDDDLQITGEKPAPAQGAGRERDEVLQVTAAKGPGDEVCRHWARGWCMRADACRYAHPRTPSQRSPQASPATSFGLSRPWLGWGRAASLA